MSKESEYKLRKHLKSDRGKLLAFIRTRLPSREEAEDLLQDVYTQAVTHLNVMQEIDNLTGWLYVLARNKIIDWYRCRKLKSIPLDQGGTVQDMIDQELPGMMNEQTRAFICDCIMEAVDDLPEEQKFVFVRQVIEGYSFREIAEQTGESINTLMTRKRYAVMALRAGLKEVREMIANP